MDYQPYQPNFKRDCRECGTSPTVVVEEHDCPQTDLCGECFFGERTMRDYRRWNQTEAA